MATVKFRLDNPKNSDATAIRVCLYVSKHKRPEVSTGLTIEPKHWNSDKERAKATLTNHTKLNLRLIDIEKDLPELWESNKEFDREQLKRLIQEYFRGADWNIKPEPNLEKKNDAPFVEYVNSFITECRSGRIVRKGSTVDTYDQTLDHVKNFAALKRLYLTFESIDLEFYKGFTSYLWDTAGHSDNTVGKHIKNIKTFMNNAFDDELHTCISFKKKKFKKITAETDEVYLTQDEITKIYSINLSDSPNLAITRDLFVFACWTGVRFGDLCDVRPEQVEQRIEGKLLRVHTGKTNEDVVIPFHPLAEAIYSYYDCRLPRIEKSENSLFNADLKEICRRAGLEIKHQSRTVVRGRASFVYLRKWEMVSAHTARRSFATNCMLMGIPKVTIMAITGHKTEKAFNKYIRITKDEHAQIMLKAFNSTPINSLMRLAK